MKSPTISVHHFECIAYAGGQQLRQFSRKIETYLRRTKPLEVQAACPATIARCVESSTRRKPRTTAQRTVSWWSGGNLRRGRLSIIVARAERRWRFGGPTRHTRPSSSPALIGRGYGARLGDGVPGPVSLWGNGACRCEVET